MGEMFVSSVSSLMISNILLGLVFVQLGVTARCVLYTTRERHNKGQQEEWRPQQGLMMNGKGSPINQFQKHNTS